MKIIALHDAEKEHIKNKIFPNLALMKISSYYKSQGYAVEWINFLEQHKYEKIYSSKVFDFTPTNEYLRDDTIKGGTGYGLYDELPNEIDSCFPDYTIYPECDYAIGFLTRGCINNCSFCVVPKKEGDIRPYMKWQDLVRNDTNKLVLMDNNILACEHGINQLKELSESEYKIDLNQGMDISLISDLTVKTLAKMKWIKYIRFSCDKAYQLPYFKIMYQLFKQYNMPVSKVFIYVLVQKDLEDADNRIQELHKICKSFNLYAQAERNSLMGIEPNKLQLEFAQRYVYGRSYKKETWKEYCKRIGLDEV